jgi:peptide/nickel transport system permease protein
VALVFAAGLGVPLGYLAARRWGGVLDQVTVLGTLAVVVLPVFVLAFLLKQIVAVDLGWLPPSGRQSDVAGVNGPTGFAVLDGLLAGRIDVALDAARHLVLPAIALAALPLAMIIRITRAAVLDVLNSDHVRVAEAKGLRQRTIRGRHVLRAAMPQVTTMAGLQLGLLLTGAVLTEKIFNWGGLGSLLADGIRQRDFPRLQALIMVAALGFVVVNLLVDVSYAILDPRIRLR